MRERNLVLKYNYIPGVPQLRERNWGTPEANYKLYKCPYNGAMRNNGVFVLVATQTSPKK